MFNVTLFFGTRAPGNRRDYRPPNLPAERYARPSRSRLIRINYAPDRLRARRAPCPFREYDVSGLSRAELRAFRTRAPAHLYRANVLSTRETHADDRRKTVRSFRHSRPHPVSTRQETSRKFQLSSGEGKRVKTGNRNGRRNTVTEKSVLNRRRETRDSSTRVRSRDAVQKDWLG